LVAAVGGQKLPSFIPAVFEVVYLCITSPKSLHVIWLYHRP
jgi:hypothetical protein